jgi:pimeloyl-ACP methyl ester carboxylesterase
MDNSRDFPLTLPLGPEGTALHGTLGVPERAKGAVVFAHGSGSSRLSPRNRHVAAALRASGFATLLFDLLTEEEAADRARVFDIPLLAGRLLGAVRMVRARPETAALPLGLFGASTGAAAALVAAAEEPDSIAAVVSRGGRPDLAGPALARVGAPTLLLVGAEDRDVVALNRAAMADLGGPVEVRLIPGATHLFEEPGTLDEVVRHAIDWFERHLRQPVPQQ